MLLGSEELCCLVLVAVEFTEPVLSHEHLRVMDVPRESLVECYQDHRLTEVVIQRVELSLLQLLSLLCQLREKSINGGRTKHSAYFPAGLLGRRILFDLRELIACISGLRLILFLLLRSSSYFFFFLHRLTHFFLHLLAFLFVLHAFLRWRRLRRMLILVFLCIFFNSFSDQI